MARSLNKATIIGNIASDIDLRKTPQGSSVVSFVVATNREWKTDSGDKREEAQFHKCVAWARLADICSEYLHKGSKVFIEGRMQTRQYEKDEQKRSVTEIVLDDMIILDKKGGDNNA